MTQQIHTASYIGRTLYVKVYFEFFLHFTWFSSNTLAFLLDLQLQLQHFVLELYYPFFEEM